VHAENLAGLGDFQNQGLAFGGGGRELNPALTQHVNSAGRLTFHEEHGAGWVGCGVLDSVESFEGTLGKGTEKALAPQFADDTIFHQLETVWRPHTCLRDISVNMLSPLATKAYNSSEARTLAGFRGVPASSPAPKGWPEDFCRRKPTVVPNCLQPITSALQCRDVYHRAAYLGSQTLAHCVTENPAHNGSIKAGGIPGLIAATSWARSRHFRPKSGVRESSSGLHQATDRLRITTTLLYPKRLPPLVCRAACRPRAGGSCDWLVEEFWRLT
jgi:hypothetical protein